MNRYRLLHVTEFQYDGPVSESYNQVWLRPRQDELQSCLSFRLTTDPHSRASSYVDPLGNWVHRFNIIPEHRRLRVEAESVVLVQQPIPMPEETIRLETLGDTEVTSARIGEMVMDGLKGLDSVAYIRFASVYKDFREARDFEEFAGSVGE